MPSQRRQRPQQVSRTMNTKEMMIDATTAKNQATLNKINHSENEETTEEVKIQKVLKPGVKEKHLKMIMMKPPTYDSWH